MSSMRFSDAKKYDRVVFLGDYFDDFRDTPESGRATAEWLRTNVRDSRFTFLHGNHDLARMFGIQDREVGGYAGRSHSRN
jgi:metallophosphoesterase superfamily enzyme